MHTRQKIKINGHILKISEFVLKKETNIDKYEIKCKVTMSNQIMITCKLCSYGFICFKNSYKDEIKRFKYINCKDEILKKVLNE